MRCGDRRRAAQPASQPSTCVRAHARFRPTRRHTCDIRPRPQARLRQPRSAATPRAALHSRPKSTLKLNEPTDERPHDAPRAAARRRCAPCHREAPWCATTVRVLRLPRPPPSHSPLSFSARSRVVPSCAPASARNHSLSAPHPVEIAKIGRWSKLARAARFGRAPRRASRSTVRRDFGTAPNPAGSSSARPTSWRAVWRGHAHQTHTPMESQDQLFTSICHSWRPM